MTAAALVFGPLRAEARDGFARYLVELQNVAGVPEAARFALDDEGFHALDEIPEQPLAFRICAKLAASTGLLVIPESIERVLEPPAGTAEAACLFLGNFVLQNVDESFAHSVGLILLRARRTANPASNVACDVACRAVGRRHVLGERGRLVRGAALGGAPELPRRRAQALSSVNALENDGMRCREAEV